ncbi:MAG: ABC transporter substrate-binding protein [Treponema sp.]|jgi:putative aldouronate transport system substrate-binding protein|nr:ABC transporter substrate-binding protein [Treponema sp.]
MRKTQLFGLAVMMLLILTLVLSGCGNKAAAGGGGSDGLDTSKQVELSLYVIGVEPPKQAELYENFNKIALEKVNATLKVNWIGWAEYPTKYPVLFSSGEAFDMSYAATWLNFAALAQRGAFLELDEMWPKYAPQNYARQSRTAIGQAAVNGRLYAIPTLQATYSAYGPVYRADLATPYGWDGKMDNFEDLEKFMEIVHANNPGIEPYQVYQSGSEADDSFIYQDGMFAIKGSTNDFFFFDPRESNPKLFTWWEYGRVNEFLTMMKRWNDKGFIYKSGLSDADSEKFRNGKSAIYFHNIDTYESQYRDHPQWDVRWNNFVSDVSNMSFTQDALVFPTTAKNPERALALYELITNDEQVFRAFFYGVEGKSYELVNEGGQYQIRGINADYYGFSNLWAARTNEFVLPVVGAPPDLKQRKAAYDAYIKDGVKSQKYRSLVIDTTSVETEYSACISVHQQYWWPLELGYVDMASGLRDYQDKMTAAGIEKVRAALQNQLDDYVANFK